MSFQQQSIGIAQRRPRLVGMLRLLLIAATLAPSGRALAENKDVARAAYHDGQLQFEVGDFKGALANFKKAYLNYEEPAFLYNIALCQRALGDKAEALRTYRIFLRKNPPPEQRAEAERHVAELQAAVDREKATQPQPQPIVSAPSTKPETKPVTEPQPQPQQLRTALVTPEPALVASPSPRKKPVYKKAWFWGVVTGAAIVVGAGVGLGVGLGANRYPSGSIGAVTVN